MGGGRPKKNNAWIGMLMMLTRNECILSTTHGLGHSWVSITWNVYRACSNGKG